ncbi:purine-nucleoside phosphorylase [uncultured Kordia sp.]|uniref:purine-nucleoside phosphorylase n=1 Tax=uncultured Kordia sp. TaxID=507699 RepID=UPI00260E76D4|nr:purine-nucleoside phosphorylase [uncultured Kordia sp.]
MLKHITETTEYLISKGFDNPEIGIVLGTGLGKLIDDIDIVAEAHYNNIPYFPLATVEFHTGKLVFGHLAGKKVVVMQGRFHLYEGYDFVDITYPIRIMHKLGIQKLLVSNAAGAINLDYKKGDIMIIDDHINLQGGSPLAFKGVSQFGERFADMSAPYDADMIATVEKIAADQNIDIQKGVYASVVGPQLETRAEYRMLKIIGADAVGMSTVPEVIVANHLNLPCMAVSVLTDECDPDNLAPVDIADIIAVAGKAEPKMITLFSELIKTL